MLKGRQLFQIISSRQWQWRQPCLARLLKEIDANVQQQQFSSSPNERFSFCTIKGKASENVFKNRSLSRLVIESKLGLGAGLRLSPRSRRFFIHPVSNFQHQWQQRNFQDNFNFKRSNHNDSKIVRFRKKMWTVVKVIFLVTGAVVWSGGAIALLFIDEVKVEEIGDVLGPPVNDEVKLRTLTFYDVLKENDTVDDISEGVQEEMTFKERSFRVLWNKLKNEETIKLKFGDPVQICGFRCAKVLHDKMKGHSNAMIPKSSKNSWHASCYVEGSKGIGILKMKFERPNSNIEWVITSAHLQMLETSNEILCDVSGSLPNGLKNFTRLSKNL